MKLEDAIAVLESLRELTVDPLHLVMGSSYSSAKQRRKAAIKIMKKVIRKLELEISTGKPKKAEK